MASRFSVSETGRPAALSSWMNRRGGRAWGQVHRQFLGGLGDVALVLEQDVQRLLGRSASMLSIRAAPACGPVERLGIQAGFFTRSADGGTMRAIWRQVLEISGTLVEHDLFSRSRVGVSTCSIGSAASAPPTLTGVVRRQEDESAPAGLDRAPSRGSTPCSRRGSPAAAPRSRPTTRSTSRSAPHRFLARIASSSGRVSRNSSEKMSSCTSSRRRWPGRPGCAGAASL